MSDAVEFRRSASLSIQRALLDMVPASLRGVAVRAVYPNFEARFLFESVGKEERELTDDVEAEAAADFWSVAPRFTPVAAPLGTARELEDGEFWVYLRREGRYD